MIDRHIAVCKAAEKKLAEESVAAGKMAVIHNGIDVRRFGLPCDRDATRRSYGLRPDMPLVGMIGRCSKEKGGELFLAALRLLKDRGTRFQALIAGDGPERDSWQNLSRRLGIDEVTFPGHVPAERMPEVMSCLDVAVISSHAEALSIAAIELMSSGVPVVATDVGGNREVVIDGVTGFIVPPNRPEQIADRIIELIRAPERSRRMKGKAIERSRRMFSAESMARSYSRLYSEVLAEKSRLSLSLQKA
jgi:glycosyltransferase involved in cell wall biosynthesis